MTFKKLSIEQGCFTSDDIRELRAILKQQCKNS